MYLNILFSTTRQWNPGDEFILLGAIRLFERTMGKFNPIIYNRNPDIRQGSKFHNIFLSRKTQRIFEKHRMIGKSFLRTYLRIGFHDNSFKPDTDPGIIDLVVFAGSPEWYGDIVKPLSVIIERYQIPCVFMGIGLGEPLTKGRLEPEFCKVLNRSYFISVRDQAALELLQDYHARYLPCPALLSAKSEKKVVDVKRVALIYMTDHAVVNHRVCSEMYAYLLRLFQELIRKYDTFLVCHYIDELESAKKEFPGMDIRYSYDAKDYFEIYGECDMVIGTRVHGIGICASMGIPGVMLQHDMRGDTVRGFLGEIINYQTDDIKEAIRKIDSLAEHIRSRSEELVKHKKETMRLYEEALAESVKSRLKHSGRGKGHV